jgi:hypothetical protein
MFWHCILNDINLLNKLYIFSIFCDVNGLFLLELKRVTGGIFRILRYMYIHNSFSLPVASLSALEVTPNQLQSENTK